jgi:ComF family protein
MHLKLDTLLLRYCVLCGVRLAQGHFCKHCFADLPWIRSACERCGQPVESASICADCQARMPAFHKAAAPLVYDFPVDRALKALKFKRQLFHAPAFGELLLAPFMEVLPDVDALLPVPLHRRRHASRGFNQATELCKPLGRLSRLPVLRNVRRVKYTAPQTGLDAQERHRNMKSAFRICGPIRYRHPLVVDDVMTTGETCNQLARALLEAGAEKVSVLTVARALSP